MKIFLNNLTNIDCEGADVTIVSVVFNIRSTYTAINSTADNIKIQFNRRLNLTEGLIRLVLTIYTITLINSTGSVRTRG